MTRTCEQALRAVFDSWARTREGALVFTTFGLDEAVLVELLERYAVPREARIVVFHDVLKHRCPGLLRHHFPDSRIVAVQLTSAGRGCPVFHAKLWMHLSKRPFRCVTAAIHSANLTRFHLDERSSTLENAVVVQDVDVPLRDLVTPKRVFGGEKGHGRVKVRPETVFVDLRANHPVVSTSTKPAHRLVQVATDGAAALACAAPFVGTQALEWLGCDAAFTGERRSLKLHAKLIEYPDVVITGSVNLTSQALGLKLAAPINTESVVVLRRPRGSSFLKRVLKGFPRVERGATGVIEPGEGEELGEDGEPDWAEARRRVLAAPRAVQPVLANGKVHLRLCGRASPVSELQLWSSAGVKSAKPAKRPFGSQAAQRDLERILSSPDAELRGLRYGKEEWRCPVDLGELWPLIEPRRPAARFQEASPEEGEGKRGGAGRRGGASVDWMDDVRTLRRQAVESHGGTPRSREWARWKRAYGAKRRVPEWCSDLAERLMAGNGHG